MKKLYCAIICFFAILPLFAAPDGWVTNYDKAIALAKNENKLLLINFTGSDWCSWCIKLKKEVFNTNFFKENAPSKFILLYIDFPHDTSIISQSEQINNPAIAEKFNIKGYPTIIVLDQNEKIISRTGYKKGGPINYLASLNQDADNFFFEKNFYTEITKLSGNAKLLRIDAYLSKLSYDERNEKAQLLQEIFNGDFDNKLNLQSKYAVSAILIPQVNTLYNNFLEQQKKIQSQITLLQQKKDDNNAKMQIQKMAEEFSYARSTIFNNMLLQADSLDKKYNFKGETRQEFLIQKALIYLQLQNYNSAKKLLNEALIISPSSNFAQIIKEIIKKIPA